MVNVLSFISNVLIFIALAVSSDLQLLAVFVLGLCSFLEFFLSEWLAFFLEYFTYWPDFLSCSFLAWLTGSSVLLLFFLGENVTISPLCEKRLNGR